MTRQSTVFGGGGTPNWQYLLLDQDTQLVNGDAKAAEIARGIFWTTGSVSGFSVDGNILTIAAGTHPNGAAAYADNIPKTYSDDFVLEVHVPDMASIGGARGLQVSKSPEFQNASDWLVTAYYANANQCYVRGGLLTDTVVSDTTGLVRLESVSGTLSLYVGDSLVESIPRPAGDVYLKMVAEASTVANAQTIEALQPLAPPTSATPKLLLPVSPVGDTSSVNVRDFTGDASVGNAITVQASVPVIVDMSFVPPTQAGYSLNGDVMTIAQGTEVGDVCPYADNAGNPLAFAGDFIFEAQIGEINTCFGYRGIQVGFSPDDELITASVVTIKAYRYDPNSYVRWEGAEIAGDHITGGAGLCKIVVEGTSLQIYVDDSLQYTGTRPSGDLYLKLWGQEAEASYYFNVPTTVTALQPLTASAPGAGPYIFGQSTYNITTPKGSFAFISPLGTEDWVADDNSTWGNTPTAREAPLQEPSTDTTDIGAT